MMRCSMSLSSSVSPPLAPNSPCFSRMVRRFSPMRLKVPNSALIVESFSWTRLTASERSSSNWR